MHFLDNDNDFWSLIWISSAEPTTFNLFNTQVNVTYTLDVFGGVRREIESMCALVDYQRYELETTYLTLASNIVSTAITEASLREQIKATNVKFNLKKRLLISCINNSN